MDLNVDLPRQLMFRNEIKNVLVIDLLPSSPNPELRFGDVSIFFPHFERFEEISTVSDDKLDTVCGT
jgi:hypothetical protein